MSLNCWGVIKKQMTILTYMYEAKKKLKQKEANKISLLNSYTQKKKQIDKMTNLNMRKQIEKNNL